MKENDIDPKIFELYDAYCHSAMERREFLKRAAAMTVVGAGAGAYAGHELEKNMNKSVSYEIRVRMDDHSIRTFRSPEPDVGVGQRVKVRDGRLVRAG